MIVLSHIPFQAVTDSGSSEDGYTLTADLTLKTEASFQAKDVLRVELKLDPEGRYYVSGLWRVAAE